MSANDYTVPVGRGAALLDEVRPGWAREIDLDRLALHDRAPCVFGQLYGGYLAGLRALGVDIMSSFDFDHGFDIPDEDRRPADYPALTAAWRAAILARRPQEAAHGPQETQA